MHITVDRFTSDSDSTLSRVSVDGRFVCFGLEDEYREVKVSGETRIPAGEYRIGLRREGGFSARYSRRFSNVHRGMLEVLDVPNFKWILVHCGNTDEHTAGCLIVGLGCDSSAGDMRLTSSARAYLTLYPLVINAAERGDLTIEYQDNDGDAIRLA